MFERMEGLWRWEMRRWMRWWVLMDLGSWLQVHLDGSAGQG